MLQSYHVFRNIARLFFFLVSLLYSTNREVCASIGAENKPASLLRASCGDTISNQPETLAPERVFTYNTVYSKKRQRGVIVWDGGKEQRYRLCCFSRWRRPSACGSPSTHTRAGPERSPVRARASSSPLRPSTATARQSRS